MHVTLIKSTTQSVTWHLLHTHCNRRLLSPTTRLANGYTFSDIEIEEVTIENGLDAAGDDCNEVKEAFHVVAIDPVEDVQSSVDAECKQVVTCDCLRLPRLTDHEQLWKNSHWLQVDGKRPQNLNTSQSLQWMNAAVTDKLTVIEKECW